MPSQRYMAQPNKFQLPAFELIRITLIAMGTKVTPYLQAKLEKAIIYTIKKMHLIEYKSVSKLALPNPYHVYYL